MSPKPSIVCLSFLMLVACKSNTTEWSGIDYQKVARENYRLQNDQFYTPPPPSVIGCVDDDLQNCQNNGYNPGSYY